MSLPENLSPRKSELARSPGPDEPLPSETPVSPGEAMRAAARQLRERGYGIVWLRPGEKTPWSKGWQLASREPGAYSPGDNLGLLCGHLSGDLVCIDLDDPRAIELADEYLPPTGMVEGRPGKPRSHRYYRVTHIPEEMTSPAAGGMGGPWKKKFPHPSGKGVLIDFLGTGSQAAVPPSLHQASGERRSWYGPDGEPTDTPGEPATVPMEALWEAACSLAEACGGKRPGRTSAAPPGVSRGRGKRTSSEPRPTAGPAGGCWEEVPVASRVERCRRYLAAVEGAVSGKGGHPTTYRVARLIVNDFAVPEEEAWDLLQEYNEGCEPPWTNAELDHKLDDALAAPDDPAHPRGCKLTPDGGPTPPAVPPDDPDRLAESFLGGNTWRYWNDEFWAYDGTRYVPRRDSDARPMVWGFVRKELDRAGGDKHRKVSRDLVGNVVGALQARCHLLPETEQPSWLDGRTGVDFLALRNGILDLQTLELLRHSPDWFSPVCLPYEYDPAAECPHWRDALGLSLGGDGDLEALLQEWFGYLLVRDTGAQRFVILVGEGNNGKSVVCAALEAMLGSANVSSVPLEKFGAEFHLAATLGKLANVCAEIGELDKTAEGTLKQFTTGEKMPFNRKNLPILHAAPTARVRFATNNLPRFNDRSSGLWRRLIPIPFRVQVPAERRVPGMDKPTWWEEHEEVPGILNWALRGLARLRANNLTFTEPEAVRRLREEHRTESNPARSFLLEAYEACPDGWVSSHELYQGYRSWCHESGYLPLGKSAFGREVGRVFPASQAHKRKEGGKACNGFQGLRPTGAGGLRPPGGFRMVPNGSGYGFSLRNHLN